MTACPATKNDQHWTVHSCIRDQYHLGYHQTRAGFLFADEAVADPTHLAVAAVQYAGDSAADVEAIRPFVLSVSVSVFAVEHSHVVNVTLQRRGMPPHPTTLFPKDWLVRYEDGTVRLIRRDRFAGLLRLREAVD